MKKALIGALLIFFVAAVIPWIYLNQEYGMHNIPHYDLTMWIFMELYILICGLVLIGIIAAFSGEEEPRRKKPEKKLRLKKEKKPKKPRAPKKKTQVKEETTEEEAPAELQDKPGEPVEYPAEWDEEEFE